MKGEHGKEDEFYMSFALKLAEIGRGYTSPNPLVGAVIVKEGRVIGIGYHRKRGEEHAEVLAIKDARGDTKDSTMYVNLEPHSFYGLVPPCTDAIIKAGIKRVVIAIQDPNPNVNGRGIAILKENGVDVEVGVLAKEARFQNRIFIKAQSAKMPYVIGKVALSLDGFMADEEGNSRWISSIHSRRTVHKLRGEVDAVGVGRNTLERDNPFLNPRLVHPAKMPIRFVITKRSIDNFKRYNFFSIHGKKWIVTTEKVGFSELPDETEIIRCGSSTVSLKCFLKKAFEKRVQSVLIEGGSMLLSDFLKNELIDELIIFISNSILGKGLSPFSKLSFKIGENDAFELYEQKTIDNDIMLRYLKHERID